MFGAVCYHPALTKELSQLLEFQQKRALAIILGSKYQSYKNAVSLTSLPRLDTLRGEACLRWATKAQGNPLHADLFPLNPSEVETRWRPKYKEYKCRTDKFYRSAVPSMIRALNVQDRVSKINQPHWHIYINISVAAKDDNVSTSLAEPPTLYLSLYLQIKNH